MKQLDARGRTPLAAVLGPWAVGVVATVEDVRIRPYGVADGERLRRMSAHLSSASLYARFFTGTPRIPEHYVRTLRALDHWDREAMVALLDGEIIGVAEYVRDARRPACAEVAVLVADPWQRCGIGGLLVAHLAGLALRRGVTEFAAEVMAGNRQAVRAIRGRWPAARPVPAGGTARFRLPLCPPVPAPRPAPEHARHPG